MASQHASHKRKGMPAGVPGHAGRQAAGAGGGGWRGHGHPRQKLPRQQRPRRPRRWVPRQLSTVAPPPPPHSRGHSGATTPALSRVNAWTGCSCCVLNSRACMCEDGVVVCTGDVFLVLDVLFWSRTSLIHCLGAKSTTFEFHFALSSRFSTKLRKKFVALDPSGTEHAALYRKEKSLNYRNLASRHCVLAVTAPESSFSPDPSSLRPW